MAWKKETFGFLLQLVDWMVEKASWLVNQNIVVFICFFLFCFFCFLIFFFFFFLFFFVGVVVFQVNLLVDLFLKYV